MRFSLALSALPTLLAFAGTALGSPTASQIQRRQIIKPTNGISEPAAGSTISGGSSFPFAYSVDNWCEVGYTPLTVWLVPGPNPPTAASLNATQLFSPGDYLEYFGAYLVRNFSPLPPMLPGPPPSTFSMPVLDPSYIDTTVYVTVVQIQQSCPPDGHKEYDIASVGITYTA